MSKWCIQRVKTSITSSDKNDMLLYYSSFGTVKFHEISSNKVLRITVETPTDTQPQLEIGDTISTDACTGNCVCNAPVFSSHSIDIGLDVQQNSSYANDITFSDDWKILENWKE